MYKKSVPFEICIDNLTALIASNHDLKNRTLDTVRKILGRYSMIDLPCIQNLVFFVREHSEKLYRYRYRVQDAW